MYWSLTLHQVLRRKWYLKVAWKIYRWCGGQYGRNAVIEAYRIRYQGVESSIEMRHQTGIPGVGTISNTRKMLTGCLYLRFRQQEIL